VGRSGRWLLVGLTLVATAAPAVAQNAAWTAAARVMIARDPQARQVAAAVKQACGIDVAASIASVAIDAADPRTGKPSGIILIGLTGVDEARLRACVPRYTRVSHVKVTLRPGNDGVTEVTHDGDRYLVGFPSPRMLAVALDPSDRPALAAMLRKPAAPARPAAGSSGAVTPPPAAPPTLLGRARRKLRELAGLAAALQAGMLETAALHLVDALDAGQQRLDDLVDGIGDLF